MRRRGLLLSGLLLLSTLPFGGCTADVARPGSPITRPEDVRRNFVMPDGMVLPYREWLPAGKPQAVILALHGMNDSRDAWEYPAPDLAAAGFAVLAPDLRGFGATATRGLWPGTDGLTGDARTMARLLRRLYPHTKLILMAESMGAAALMVLATEPDPPDVDGYVLVAPAVWGRSKMDFPMRATLWTADHLVPGLRLSGGGFIKVTATDNREALYRLSTDPLTLHNTRVDAIEGLVDLMDRAMAAAPNFHAPALFLYGRHDELVPPRAMAATWRALPRGATLAYYPQDYHLMLRDKNRHVPIDDIIAWIRNPRAPLPSGAEKAARAWLAKPKPPLRPPPSPVATGR
jgi:acylglycerol lipase